MNKPKDPDTTNSFTPALEQIRKFTKEAQGLSPAEVVHKAMEIIAHTRKDSYWTGVYLLRGNELHVGPYVGPTTEHTRIPVGRGVCGTAVAENANQIVQDVSAISNYLACNIYTKSEIVVLIRDPKSRAIIGQIDIDSTVKNAFSKEDEAVLDIIAAELAPFAAKCEV